MIIVNQNESKTIIIQTLGLHTTMIIIMIT